VLAALIHFTGGIENPFIFFFVFHVIIAGILLHHRVAYFVATAAILLVLLLVGLEYNGVIDHVHLAGFAPTNLYTQGTYILGVLVALTACLYASAYMVTHLSGELRKRQREVVALKDSGIREKAKELKEATRELAKLEEGRKNLLHFLGVVAHDLKAPLSAVQSYLQLMVGGFAGEIDDKQRHMLSRSSQRLTELLELISDLLDISRIEAGQIVSEFEEISLSQTVKDSLENVRSQAKEKKVALKVEMPRSLPQIKASGIRLQQVMTNLLTNAIKFTPEKGTIKLRVTEQQNDILVEVMDTGTGIAAEELPKIFDDFYRGIDSTKSGTGLGLSIVRRIIEAHKGRIWSESPNPEDELARGSKFTFILPKDLDTAGNGK
jgi:signal transduction histidine kinase